VPEYFFGSGGLVVRMEGEKSGGDPEVPQQDPGIAGVFGQDQGYLAEDAGRAGGEVFQIPHRGAD
jgi:hypothetical protein